MTRVYLEQGKRWTFACAVDWPGWCRRGKGDEAALEALQAYAPRYAAVAGDGWSPGDVRVIGTVPGSATTEFGAPDARGPWDDEPIDDGELARQVGLLRRSWAVFDGVVAAAPEELRKGPRGGGRDRDAVAEHVREAERAYGRSCGVKIPSGTPWPEHRDLLAAALLDPSPDAKWPVRYALRRIAWHVLDHAWEIEDRAAPAG